MQKKYDAIVIGAGVIGCCVGFELAKKGYKTLNVDKLGEAGIGSTGGSCAIIRFHYSTTEGVALAREGYYYWLDWPTLYFFIPIILKGGKPAFTERLDHQLERRWRLANGFESMFLQNFFPY